MEPEKIIIVQLGTKFRHYIGHNYCADVISKLCLRNRGDASLCIFPVNSEINCLLQRFHTIPVGPRSIGRVAALRRTTH